MAADLLCDKSSSSLTEAHDRLLDVLAEHLVEEYLKEIEAGPTGHDRRLDCEGQT
jgi:hypothetical protein